MAIEGKFFEKETPEQDSKIAVLKQVNGKIRIWIHGTFKKFGEQKFLLTGEKMYRLNGGNIWFPC